MNPTEFIPEDLRPEFELIEANICYQAIILNEAQASYHEVCHDRELFYKKLVDRAINAHVDVADEASDKPTSVSLEAPTTA